MVVRDVTSVSTSSRYLCFRATSMLFFRVLLTFHHAVIVLQGLLNHTSHVSHLRLDRANSVRRRGEIAVDRSYDTQGGSCTAM